MGKDSFRFCHTLKVRFPETDASGVIFFGEYFTYFDVAITEYLGALGIGMADLEADGLDVRFVQAEAQFKLPVVFEDVLKIYARTQEIGNTSWTFAFEVYRAGEDRLAASGQCVMVMVTRGQGASARVPDRYRKLVELFERS